VRAIRLDLSAREDWLSRKSWHTYGGWRPGDSPRRHIQFYAPGTVVRDLLPYLADLETNSSSTMGYMLESDGLTDTDFERLLDLPRGGNCWIKLFRALPHRQGKATVHCGTTGPRTGGRPSGPADLGLATGRTSPTASATPASCSTSLRLAPDEADRSRFLVGRSPPSSFFAT